MIHSRKDVLPLLTVWCPCDPVVRVIMHKGVCDWGQHWSVIVVECHIELHIY